ncbi:bifunctional metallophosphatase/5'-nucleotidase [Natronomonas marina]|uniref:bifunctional metallophosphatase/5'-nucleotidase n=1 Tax=Natronomonas marina TaxID=2961939 RepID=UPI0020C9C8C1|nr:bifunctional metallophosphatase/5'-nucleotidase [Natronomonas marina]
MRLLHYSDIENAHDDPDRVARLAGLIDELRGEDAVVCGTGDNVAPGVLPLVTRGEQALDFFEVVDPDFSTFGNHDFDFGIDRTAELVARSPQRWLSANVSRNGDRFAGVDPWAIRTVDGARVGFLGLTDPTTPSGSDSAAALEFADPTERTNRAVEALEERGAEYVVVLSHLGRADDRLAAACDVDVVLGGHVHSERVERVAGTLLTRPGDGGRTVLEVDLETREVTRHPVEEAAPEEALAERYRRRLDATGLDEVVGRVDDPIERTEREAFRGESRVGNFVADAYRWAAERELGTNPPVVGLQNSGGIRTGPPLAGEVTVGDLVSLVPFEEAMAVAELSGRELRAVFREAADTTGFGESDWWHAHVSGARLVYDYADDALLEAHVDGDPVDDDARYRLAVSEFLLNTDAEFPTLTERAALGRYDVQYEVLADYARTVGIDPELEGRVTRQGL